MTVEFLHGDCLEVLRDIGPPAFDVTITDPPYTQHVQDRLLAGKKKSNVADAYTKEIECPFPPLTSYEFVPRVIGLTKRWSLFFCALEQLGEYQNAAPERWVRSGIYCKARAMPQMTGDRPGNRCEGITIFHPKGKKRWNGGGGHAFWFAMPENRKDTLHPTAKPLMLCMRLVELFSEPGETVFDPFCGTGNIGIACALLGRSYVGIDIDEAHVANAEKRLSEVYHAGMLAKYEAYKATKGQEAA